MATRPNKPGNISDEQIPGTYPTITQDAGSTAGRRDEASGGDKAKAKAQQAGAATKNEAGRVADNAKQGGKQVAAEAQAQVGEVAHEARRQVGDLVEQARSAASSQAGQQQQRVASTVRGYADEFQALLNGKPQQGVVTDLAHSASDRVTTAAQWLESRDPQDLVQEVSRFARRRPMAFLAMTAGAGFLAGRLGRGVKDAGSDDDQYDNRHGYTQTYSYSDTPATGTRVYSTTQPRQEWTTTTGEGVLGQGEYR